MGHTVLIGWLLLGWGLDSDPLEFDTMVVTTVSGEEFAALNAASTPDPGTAEPDAPVQPVLDEAPEPPAESTPTEVAPPPDPVEPPVDETPPPDPPQAPPVADVTDTPPSVPSAPAPTPPAPDLDVSEDPTPRQADVVASTPTPPPPPDAAVDDAARDEAVQEPDAEPEVVQEEQEQTAPEETTTEIVNQDDTPSAPEEPVTVAPATSVRPVVRPNRPAPVEEPQVADVQEPAEPTEPAEPDTSIEDVLAGVVEDTSTTSATDAPNVPAGPPMTGSEIEGFRVAVNRCWVLDPGSEAARAKITVFFELGRDGKVVGSPTLVSGSGASDTAINTAFEAARRAILRCQGSDGYQLPPDKYEEWREITGNFDASGVKY
ncbi:energy transducer TonB [Yoonia sp. 2307UL14-13]|uniref:energy transducer TonB n=1 Tax=Yoonia sp. 2307UL14-13 TaxID=3126506 RepID=UPI0030EF6BA7